MADRKNNLAKLSLGDARLSDLITVNEAATLRGVTQQAIWDLINRERFRFETLFGRTLVYRAEVLAFNPKVGRPPKVRKVS